LKSNFYLLFRKRLILIANGNCDSSNGNDTCAKPAVSGARCWSAFLGKYSHLNWALADQALVSAVNFMTGILLARALGLTEYGRFTLVWMAPLFLNSLQSAAIITPMMSLGPKQGRGQESLYYGVVLVHEMVWTLSSFLLLLVGVWCSQFLWPQWQIQPLALPLAMAAAAYQLQDFVRRLFFVRGLPAIAFLNDSISYLGQLLLLGLLFRHLDVSLALFIIACTSILAVLTSSYWLRSLSFVPGRYKSIAHHHWHFSKWLIGSALMQWTSGNYFIIAASSQLGPIAAGAMRAAQNIIAVTHILFQGLGNVVPAQSAKLLYKEGIRAFKSYITKVVVYGGGATALLCLVVGMFSCEWLDLFYGTKFIAYDFVLRWWAASYFLIFFGVPLTAGLNALENTRPVFFAYCVMTVFSLGLAVPSVKHFGLHGALAGIFLCQMIFIAILAYSLRQQIKSYCNTHRTVLARGEVD
jgi:O-antigen/teichoic acid export membrane protein